MARGGVPVAAEVARHLGAPLDVLVVRKVGAPSQPELAVGAIAEGVTRIDDAMVRALEVSPASLSRIIERETAELARRERVYRQGRPAPALAGRTVIIVDDGLATGLSALAAVEAVRRHQPRAVIFAAPVCSHQGEARVELEADQVVCALTPTNLMAVGEWYDDFRATSDDEVIEALADAAERVAADQSSA
jgi:predicted phosphoribosyltransferase